MPRHDRANGVYHSSRQSGTKRVHIGRGHGQKNEAAIDTTIDTTINTEVDMARQGGNTPKPNAPTPQKPKPGPRPGK
jgi:hypothetical protein